MKRTATASALLAALLTAAACAPDTSDSGSGGDGGDKAGGGKGKKVTLTLNWVPYGEHAAFYYGVEKGIYEKAGINLTIKPGHGSAGTVKQVAQGHSDFGWADTPALLAGVNEGMKVKSLGVYLQKGPSSVQFTSDQKIKTPKDLEGKTVGGTPGDALYATFPGWLKANKVDPDKVKVVNTDPAAKIANLGAGKVDAIMGFFHDQGPTVEDKTGKQVDYLLWADYGMNVLGNGIVASDKLLQDDPKLAKAFAKATAESWEQAAANQGEAVKIMSQAATGAPPEKVLANQLKLTLPLLQDKHGANTEAKWQETIDLLKDGGMLKKAQEPSAYWDASYAGQG
ncbi:ABC transporter substrate-binding protein [Streptomyces sp. A7024]|uniref:ABC transporter substrate-binding protein n=1 Tax=Streptomyces coryli TaxID=1128680 RepID=A0A6G4U595_9ACTN|nr:ABC transporter substrate-binding protein [Streptomyces coryli]